MPIQSSGNDNAAGIDDFRLLRMGAVTSRDLASVAGGAQAARSVHRAGLNRTTAGNLGGGAALHRRDPPVSG